MRLLRAVVLVSAVGACAAPAPTVAPSPRTTQAPRVPAVEPLPEPSGFTRAVANGTRTRTGEPGPRYWQQRAAYRISAEVDPATWRVSSRAVIRYENRSPDTLRHVYLYLNQNLFSPTAARNEEVPVTGGTELRHVAAGGDALRAVSGDSVGYVVNGTVMRVRPRAPIAPGAALELDIAWSFTIPPDGAPREGQDGEVAMVAYWYPQLAVYDDVGGWRTDPYLANAEFYMGYADYDVSLTVPAGWLVGATGTLANASQVLSAQTIARLDAARRSPSVVRVVADDDRGAGRATLPGTGGKLTWRFTAANVRDFAFATSPHYLWDATHAVAGDDDGNGRPDTAMVHTLYRPSRRAWAWGESARYTRHSVEFLSRYLWPYGYPQMTAIDGVVSCSGMEYPMLTCIGGRRDSLTLYSVIVHETAHMWFPMQVGSDERRHAWQDEGLTRFNQTQAIAEFYPAWRDTYWNGVRNSYLGFARTGREVELMRHGDLYPPDGSYGVASYQKTAVALHAVRSLLGTNAFDRAYREYGRRWRNRHPTPLDLFNTFHSVTGQDLTWFWRTWMYETWPLDHAIASVTATASGTEVVVEDRGMAPMPARVLLTRADGSTHTMTVTVAMWLEGARRVVLRAPAGADVVRVELDPSRDVADVDSSNDVWQRPR